MQIEAIDQRSPKLALVKHLWRQHSNTLGFFTDEAFSDYAQRRRIIIASSSDGALMGYLMYRITRGIAVIVHLCSSLQYRGQGVAKALVGYLKERTQNCYGIRLKCRTDYVENKIWPRLGFVNVNEVPGRGKDGKLLAIWAYDHGQPNLFRCSVPGSNDVKLSAVIDANVFIDLYGKGDYEGEESRGLTSDDLVGDVDYYVTPELLNEIARHGDIGEVKKYREIAYSLPMADADSRAVDATVCRLKSLFKNLQKEQNLSDIRQLAYTIESGSSCFITRDKDILDLAEKVYDEYGVSIYRPVNFILRVDELTREADYQPVRLVGSRIHIRPVCADDDESIISTRFWSASSGERRAEFDQRIRQTLSQP